MQSIDRNKASNWQIVGHNRYCFHIDFGDRKTVHAH